MTKATAATMISSVTVQPQAAVSIALHAVRHKYCSVHGILLGRCEKEAMIVTDAVPVSHGAPSLPLVETALGILQKSMNKSDMIVGWYTAPMLLEDTKPGPVALRMAANLATAAVEPVLLVVQNAALAAVVKGSADSTTQSALKALGRDFGNQWLDPIQTVMEKPSETAKAIQQAVEQGIVLPDLIDHFEDSESSSWYRNKEIRALVKNIDLS
jgi:Uncharacterised protein family (UPF0172)